MSRSADAAIEPQLAPTPWWVPLSALIGAGAAFALPGPTGSSTAIGSVLILGALALLAGHTWGLLVVAAADVLLIGHAWPLIAFSSADWTAKVAPTTMFVTALPGLAMLGVALPALVDVVLDSPSGRVRAAGMATFAVGAALALVLPAL